jgi:hypothetical protein
MNSNEKNQLEKIDHQFSNEVLTFTFIRILPSSFHTLIISLGIYTNELCMEVICGQLF